MRKMTSREKRQFKSIVNQSLILLTMLISISAVGYVAYLSHVVNVREGVARERAETNKQRASWVNQ